VKVIRLGYACFQVVRSPVRLEDDRIREQARSFLAVVLIAEKRDLVRNVTADVCPAEKVVIFVQWQAANYAAESAALTHFTLNW
jgi:hypothetical protein